MTEFMRSSDAFTWAMEKDARLRSTVVSIVLLDRSPDWSVLVERLDRLTRTVTTLRHRVVESSTPAPPRWEPDPDFDLDYHVRRVTAPQPATFETVLDMARRAEMGDFDRARPLWEVTLVDGLTEGRAALVFKLHHSLTDGIGGVQLAMILFDLTATPTDRGPMPTLPNLLDPAVWDGAALVARYNADLAGRAARSMLRSAPGLVVSSLLAPRRTASEALAVSASVYRTVRPINHTGSPLMTRRSLVRRLGVHEVPRTELLEAAHLVGGTLNDAFLAGVAGGLRRYHERHGVELDAVHVAMPVSLRADGDPVGGNRITLMRYDIPVGVVDPVERMRLIHDLAAQVRAEESLPLTQLIAGALNLLPRWYVGAILRHVDVVASNVPGIPVPVYVGGALVVGQHPFGPTIGAALNVTLMTYVDSCAIGINVDTGAIPDFDVFHACLVEGFEEVLGTVEATAGG
ncbi:wax ester/triacylglycerol synthase domain-containing protein [Nocardioides pacificus]